MRLHPGQLLQLSLAFSVFTVFLLLNMTDRMVVFQEAPKVPPTKYMKYELHVPGDLKHAQDIVNGSWIDSSISRKLRVLNDGCTDVLLAVPCTTPPQLREVVNLIKSVLYYSPTVSLTLHLVTNKHGHYVLQTLFNTWELSNVFPKYHMIETEKDSEPLSMIDTLLIVLRAEHDTPGFNKVIIAQPMVVFLQNIGEYWDKLHDHLKGNASIYISGENKGAKDENSCNENVLFVDVRKLSSVLTRLCEGRNSSQPEKQRMSFFSSGCLDKVKSFCRSSINCSEIAEFYGVTVNTVNLISEGVELVRELDGDMFRTLSSTCAKPFRHEFKLDPLEQCYRYRYLSRLKKRTHLYYFGPPAIDTSDKFAVTLVTHLLPNRIENLERQLSFWEGPVSVAVYIRDNQIPEFVQYVQSSVLLSRSDVSIHLALVRQKPPYSINYLRNIAIREVRTPYFLMLDVDFVPNFGLSQQVRKILSKMDSEKKRALIVPSFETLNYTYVMPKDKFHFLQDLEKNLVEAYHQRPEHWPEGHKRTDYDKWKVARFPYKVQGRFGFEPYVVLPTTGAPMYHELLLERMRDKLPYTLEVEYAGYELYVVPEAFAVHFPHARSQVDRGSGSTQFQVCAYKIYNDVLRSIKKKYGDNHR